ncbi:hypothetical protein [Streptomyces sp. MA5143a]|uniref:hypothetical protein n=1 Tax=Streptomyces sp. MA5143a TaxID=2083010 RepID=UPI0015E73E7E|nr:hypothetical protein [Streptomyces sp. MA5143a]
MTLASLEIEGTVEPPSVPAWSSAHFAEIINHLADHTQVILYFQFWRVAASRTYVISGTGLNWELEWAAPWEHLVAESHTWSLPGASEAPTGDNIFVAPTWIDPADLSPARWPMPFRHPRRPAAAT